MLKAFDTVMALKEAVGKVRGSATPRDQAQQGVSTQTASAGAQPIEARLTGVVVAALKEAFDRDHARLELERLQLEEERIRAAEALKLELRRQAADRELVRLRLIAGTALLAWLGSVLIAAVSGSAGSLAAKAALGVGWVLLLAALAAAFMAQARVNTGTATDTVPSDGPAAFALWLLVAGLAVTALSVLLA